MILELDGLFKVAMDSSVQWSYTVPVFLVCEGIRYVRDPCPSCFCSPILIAFRLLTTFSRLCFHHGQRTVYLWELSTLSSIDYCFANIHDSLNMDALIFSLTQNTNNQNGTEVFTRLVLSQKTGFGSTNFWRTGATCPRGQSDENGREMRKKTR